MEYSYGCYWDAVAGGVWLLLSSHDNTNVNYFFGGSVMHYTEDTDQVLDDGDTLIIPEELI